jgi:uncharacterized protein YceK
MNTSKGQLTIVDVPWAISASGSGARVVVDFEAECASVTFASWQQATQQREMITVRVEMKAPWAWRASPIRDAVPAYQTAGYDTSQLPFDALRHDPA